MKEKLNELQRRLSLYTSYGACSGDDDDEIQSFVPLPIILKATLNFATTPPIESDKPTEVGDPALVFPLANKSVTSVMMQVDSPCPSPKMTPASSITNLAQSEAVGSSVLF